MGGGARGQMPHLNVWGGSKIAFYLKNSGTWQWHVGQAPACKQDTQGRCPGEVCVCGAHTLCVSLPVWWDHLGYCAVDPLPPAGLGSSLVVLASLLHGGKWQRSLAQNSNSALPGCKKWVGRRQKFSSKKEQRTSPWTRQRFFNCWHCFVLLLHLLDLWIIPMK